jgi:hypothetical protein
LVADIGQRCPGGLDVVADVQICRVDNLWLSKHRFPAPTSVAASMGHTPGVSCRQKIAALIAYDWD